jgi:hypothetical protein
VHGLHAVANQNWNKMPAAGGALKVGDRQAQGMLGQI